MRAPKKPAMEYRVVWKREGWGKKSIVFQTLRAAQRRITLLGDKPWEAFDRKPDEYWCCDDHGPGGCGCGGKTVKEHVLEQGENFPKLEFARIEARIVGAWAQFGDPLP